MENWDKDTGTGPSPENSTTPESPPNAPKESNDGFRRSHPHESTFYNEDTLDSTDKMAKRVIEEIINSNTQQCPEDPQSKKRSPKTNSEDDPIDDNEGSASSNKRFCLMDELNYVVPDTQNILQTESPGPSTSSLNQRSPIGPGKCDVPTIDLTELEVDSNTSTNPESDNPSGGSSTAVEPVREFTIDLTFDSSLDSYTEEPSQSVEERAEPRVVRKDWVRKYNESLNTDTELESENVQDDLTTPGTSCDFTREKEKSSHSGNETDSGKGSHEGSNPENSTDDDDDTNVTHKKKEHDDKEESKDEDDIQKESTDAENDNKREDGNQDMDDLEKKEKDKGEEEHFWNPSNPMTGERGAFRSRNRGLRSTYNRQHVSHSSDDSDDYDSIYLILRRRPPTPRPSPSEVRRSSRRIYRARSVGQQGRRGPAHGHAPSKQSNRRPARQ